MSSFYVSIITIICVGIIVGLAEMLVESVISLVRGIKASKELRTEHEVVRERFITNPTREPYSNDVSGEDINIKYRPYVYDMITLAEGKKIADKMPTKIIHIKPYQEYQDAPYSYIGKKQLERRFEKLDKLHNKNNNSNDTKQINPRGRDPCRD